MTVNLTNQGTDKVSVSFGTGAATTVKVGFPATGDTTFQAVVDLDGNPVGGKYNPAANMVVKRTDGRFVPDEQMTRGDAAIVMFRLFQKIW